MFKFSFQQQVLTGFGITLFVVFLLAIISYISLEDQKKDATWVEHTEQVLHYNNEVKESLLEAETNQRGFIMTGLNSSKEKFNTAIGHVEPEMRRLQVLVADNPVQARNVDSLSFYVSAKIELMKELVDSDFEVSALRDSAFFRKFTISNMYMDKIRFFWKKIADQEDLLLAERKEASAESGERSVFIILIGSFLIFSLLMLLFSYIKRTFKHQKLIEERVRETNLQLRRASEENESRNWQLAGESELAKSMEGDLEVTELSNRVVTALANYTGALVGAFYLANEEDRLKLTGSYAFKNRKGNLNELKFGEGLVGQAALERKSIVFSKVPESYMTISSGLGEVVPSSILVQPVLYEKKLLGVFELGFAGEIERFKQEFLETVSDSIGVAINTAESRLRLKVLFEKTQQQTEELESQHEELRVTNEELMHKTAQLQASEEELIVQQEELRQANAELEEKAEMLEERNKAVEKGREAIAIKAEELEQTSRYKSEFLANMSHELRTPLNSILILARILKENKNANLTEEQIKYAGVIHNAGSDLLALINDILDLSKIESGKIDINIENVEMEELERDMRSLFDEVARSKGINFSYKTSADVPKVIQSDRIRIEQILKNLLSNAFKFTPEKGKVKVSVEMEESIPEIGGNELAADSRKLIAFKVSDTGIGIPFDKQKAIFEAFQQADGSTSRKYGGTGLGLSICRELAHKLGGEIKVESEVNVGSTFTFYLGVKSAEESGVVAAPELKPAGKSGGEPVRPAPVIPAKRLAESGELQKLLIIEDDQNFAEILQAYGEERGFDTLLADRGDAGLRMAKEYLPDAIILDIMLPGMNGWEVLKQLKQDPDTRKIPVHLMSARDEKESSATSNGAIGFLKKPVEKETLDMAFDRLVDLSGKNKLKRVLLVEDDEILSNSLIEKLQGAGIDVKQAYTGSETEEILKKDKEFDCIILDLKLPDTSGLQLLERIKANKDLSSVPVVINTAMELDKDSMAVVMKYTEAMVLKSNKSDERLLDEVNLFMNRIKTGKLNVQPVISPSATVDNTTMEKALKNKKVLIVDDDMRNIFALSSALEEFSLKIEIANNGREALDKLAAAPDINLVLMDLMMPEMDGYEAMRAIRAQGRFKKLPIIALTAKAMKNDRERCLEAGASDYITKPVDIDKLLSMMRVWLS